MKKHLFALLCALALLVCSVPVSALEGEALRQAEALEALGLFRGSGAGYDLDAPLTRAQAAVLLTRLSGASPEPAAPPFADVPDWAAGEIACAVRQGWVPPLEPERFFPQEPVTAEGWCAMLLRMLGYPEGPEGFSFPDAADFARRIGLLSRSYDGLVTRGDAAESLYDALDFPLPDGSGTVLDRLLSTGACSCEAAAALGLTDLRLTARQAADRHLSAVFCLNTYSGQEGYAADAPIANATGFFITGSGLAVTNFHALEGCAAAAAVLVTGERYPVESVVWYDAGMDLAVLRVSRTSAEGESTPAFAALALAGVQDLRAGDRVFALGSPLGLGPVVSEGIVSAPAVEVSRYDLPCVLSTAPISHGSSGGALLNEYGRVVAVTSGAFTQGNSLYLAVPADPLLTADLTGAGVPLEEAGNVVG